MASRMRAVDWATTPVGPIDRWPLSLRNTIDIMLPAGAQIVLFWGPQYAAFYNDAYAPTIGNKHPRALGRPAVENWTELWEDLEPLLKSVRVTGETVVAKDRPFYIERRGCGEQVYFDISYSAVRNDDGGIGGVLCIVNETTERVLAEAARRDSDAVSARLAAIVQSSDDAIVSKDLDGIIMSWNAGAERIFGYTAEEAIGRPITLLIPEDRLNEEDEILARLRRGEHTEHFETKRRRKDGSLFDISLTISPLKDRRGRVIGASKIGRDITDRKHAEQTQLLLISELNHRVKNTLASVQAIAQQTLRRTHDPQDFVHSFSGRIQSLARVHTLLSANTWRSADLRDVVRDQLLHGVADETRISLSGPQLKLDPQTALHLALMLHELGTNAAKYGALSGTSGSIAIDWTVEDRILSLSWREHGGPPVRVTSKRGFGTTLIEQSAKGEGGTAKMRIEADGVAWDIRLPLSGLLADDRRLIGIPSNKEPPSRGPQRVLTTPGKLAGKRFLIVEDEPLVALDLSESLTGAGAEVLASIASIPDALEFIGKTKLDAALLDANLHGQPVDEVAAALTRNDVPFAFVSGYSKEHLPLGFRDVPLLNKPFGPSDLLKTAAELFERGADIPRLRKR
jgi:PAS domain S-box-containing protein